MDVELDDFQDGRPLKLHTTEENGQKIKLLKGKKQYKELLDLAASMPNTKQKYMLQANGFYHSRRWKQLAQACDRGLDLAQEQESSDLFNLKGKALGKLGNFQQKVKLTSKAIQINPKVAAYHRNLGAAYYKLKKYEQAIDCHDKAIELQPNHSINYHNKGAAFFRLQKYQQALISFKKASELDKKQTVSFAWLGDTYKALGDYQKAYQNYQIAYQQSEAEQYKKSMKQMDQKINPGKKKGFFSRIFG